MVAHLILVLLVPVRLLHSHEGVRHAIHWTRAATLTQILSNLTGLDESNTDGSIPVNGMVA
jgi:hypothetical protein